MIDIAELVQQKYGIESEKDFIFFGGDQLTEERGRNVQFARSDGDNRTERLDGLFFKNEDWHFERTAYKVQ